MQGMSSEFSWNPFTLKFSPMSQMLEESYYGPLTSNTRDKADMFYQTTRQDWPVNRINWEFSLAAVEVENCE